MATISKVLALTGFSERSHRAITLATNEARLHKAELHLLHIVEEDAVEDSPDVGRISMTLEHAVAEAQVQLLRYPEAANPKQTDWLTGDTLTIFRSVREGRLNEQILDYAREHSVDLIVLATHARSGIDRLISGSVAEAVLRHSSCPLLIVPPLDNE